MKQQTIVENGAICCLCGKPQGDFFMYSIEGGFAHWHCIMNRANGKNMTEHPETRKLRYPKDYDVARQNINRMKDTCAFTVGMLVLEIDEAHQDLARLTTALEKAREEKEQIIRAADAVLLVMSRDWKRISDVEKELYLLCHPPLLRHPPLLPEQPQEGTNDSEERSEEWMRSH